MEKERLTKKQIMPIIVGVLTLVVLVASATYAYFSVTAGNTSGTTTITGDIGGDTIGSVTLTGGNTNLYLGVSADDMSETNKGKVYYSSTEEGSRETNVNSAGKTTYTATLSGDETDSVMYACDYEFTVTSTGTALGKEATSDIELVFNGDIEKTINLTGADKVSGTWYGFKNSNKERAFNAYLQLKNTEEEQNDIAGTNLSVSISNTKWKCYLSELDELVGEAYALYTENDQTLRFVRSETTINVGDDYNGNVIAAVYTGFEENVYETYAPWFENASNIKDIIFIDEIRPISTAWWFADNLGYILSTLDVTNLNTTLVTNMSYMFYSLNEIAGLDTIDGISGWNVGNVTDMSNMFLYSGIENIDLSNWDVSNVTNMSYMFHSTMYLKNIGNISKWDVSNVTNMAWLFARCPMLENIGNLSNWDVSKVTNMSNMFVEFLIDTDIGIDEWDVSNVTNMSGMFNATCVNVDINLSSWNVSNVKTYEQFNDGVSGTGTLTPPKWPTTN